MDWSPVIVPAAALYNLDPLLLSAVIAQESSGNQWAVRFEWGFYNKYVKGKTRDNLIGHVPREACCSIQTEKFDRAHSWGLCQVMGQVAREQGFTEDYLTQLLIPEVNVMLGAKFLRKKIDLAHGNIHGGLLLWNGGGNPNYPDEVLEKKGNGKAGRMMGG